MVTETKTDLREEIMKKVEEEGNFYSFNYKGMHCELRRPCPSETRMFHWCGYVATGLNECITRNQASELEVHGGVTYNDEYKGKYFVGFDCAHSGDISYLWNEVLNSYGKYRDLNYVINEVQLLADQVKAKRWKWKLEHFIEKLLNKVGLTLLKNREY